MNPLSKCVIHLVNLIGFISCESSHTVEDVELNYTMTQKELLDVIFNFEKFRPYLIKPHVIIYASYT